MRLLTRKIYRAFPELDQYDDQSCERYVNRAVRLNDELGCLLIGVIVIASVAAWIFIEYNTQLVIFYLFDAVGIKLGVYTDTFIRLVVTLGYVWFPWIMILIARDIRLRSQIRKQLDGAYCRSCGYRLIGLIILQESTTEFVRCPECGTENTVDGDTLCRDEIEVPHRLHNN
tara:strand:+ start:193 stop:708 length:516 start_codon:yes stop_codon:yes gene_type:complete